MLNLKAVKLLAWFLNDAIVIVKVAEPNFITPHHFCKITEYFQSA